MAYYEVLSEENESRLQQRYAVVVQELDCSACVVCVFPASSQLELLFCPCMVVPAVPSQFRWLFSRKCFWWFLLVAAEFALSFECRNGTTFYVRGRRR